jgi:DNA-binding XRE family transcriptional regulator
MHKEVEKIVWKYLHYHLGKSLDEGVTDSFMMSRCFDLVTKEYKKKFHEFPNGRKVPIVYAPGTILFQRLKDEKGLNQKTVAAALGVSKSVACKWAKGRETLPNKRIEELQTLLEEV